jgi:putrescine transport system substrate-binding protein
MKVPLSAVYVVLLVLAACASDEEPQLDDIQDPEEKVVNVYNWTDYIGKDTIADFEEKTGIRVVYDTYDANLVLETKLLTGASGYDVVFPTANYLQRQIEAGVFQKLDKSRLPNLVNMDPEIMKRLALNDPGNLHAIDYTWGTEGLSWNPALVQKAIGTAELDSWGAILDPAIASRLADCGIAIVDSPEHAFNMALNYLGRDPNSEKAEDLEAAEAVWMKVRPYVRYFHSSQHTNDLASGEICVASNYSNGAVQARERGKAAVRPVEIAYRIPVEGSVIWLDTMAIPVDAPHPQNAHAFMNFLMEPEVIAAVTSEMGVASGNRASLQFVPENVKSDATIYPAADVLAKLHPTLAHTPDYRRHINRAWTRIKTGQ